MSQIADYLLEVKPAGSWVTIADGQVLNVRDSWETSGDQLGVAFGDDTDAGLSGELTLPNWANVALMTPIRYTTTMGADGPSRTFTGVITRRSRTMNQLSFDATGMKHLIAATKGYSPAFARRPAATKTTASSADDPSNPGFAAGLINWLLWQAGGRPYEQAGSYPSATFYYSCDQAVLAPDWSWAAGEDAWGECLKLAKDSGGQMYQDASGVVRYRQVFGYGGQSTTDALSESDYAEIEMSEEPGLLFATRISCQYVPRRRLGTQQIADDATPRHVENGETATIVIEPQNPLASLETISGQLKSECLVVARLDGSPVSQGVSGYTHTVAVAAARITITVTNASGGPFTIWRVKLRGDPIVSGEAGSVYADSGASPVVERVLEQSPYIQNRRDAQRICDMTLAFYGAARPTVTVRGCVHKPSRAIGGALLLTCAAWSMSAQKHVIVSIQHDQTGISADYTLAYVEDLPKTDDFYIIGTTYTSSDNKKLGW
jgi:hypothetical protein